MSERLPVKNKQMLPEVRYVLTHPMSIFRVLKTFVAAYWDLMPTAWHDIKYVAHLAILAEWMKSKRD